MTATLGRFLILASVLVSTTGAMISFAAGRKHAPEGVRWAQRFAYAFAVLMIGAGLMELWLGIEAAGRELEDIAAPLSARDAEKEPGEEADMFTLGRREFGKYCCQIGSVLALHFISQFRIFRCGFPLHRARKREQFVE